MLCCWFSVLVNEINNPATEAAFIAFEKYLAGAKIPGFSLGKVGRVELDSATRYLTVDDGNIELLTQYDN